jgi:hypothetical protein
MMNKLLFLILLSFSKPILSFSQSLTNVRYEVLLNAKMFDSTVVNVQLTPQLVVSPDSLVTLSNGNQFLLLGWGGIVPFGSKANSNINSFSYTTDGLLMAVRKNDLCFLNGDGILEKIIGLPTENMTIMQGKDVMYLMDQQRNDNKYRLYAFAKGGKYKELLISPKPITAVVEKYDSIYLAVESGIYSYSPTSDQLNLVLALGQEFKIQSLAVDPNNDILYFSTTHSIYAYQSGKITMISEELGGQLAFFGNGLIIFSPETKDILRIVNINESFKF